MICGLSATKSYGGAISGSVNNYLPLLIPGLIAQTVLTACVATGTQIREDMDKGVFDRFRTLPIWRPSTMVGYLLGDAFQNRALVLELSEQVRDRIQQALYANLVRRGPAFI